MNSIYRVKIIIIAVIALFTCNSSFPQENSNNTLEKIKALMVEGNNKAAIAELKLFLQKDTANADLLYYLGLNYEAVSDYANAAQALSSAFKYQPNNIKILGSLGSNYFLSGQIPEAEAILYKAFLLDSSNTKNQILLGKVYISEKKWDKACGIYSRLVQSDSTNSYFYQSLAQCYSNLGNADQAIKFDIISNKLNPRNMDVILDLTYLFFLHEQYRNALNILDNGLKYYKFSMKLLKWKGDIYFNISNYDSALYNYQGAFYYGDKSSNIFRSIGECCYLKKEYSSAINYLEHAIELDPQDYTAYFYLGASYKAQNKFEKAMNNFKAADTLLHNQFLSSVDAQIGAIYQIKQKYKEALEYYNYAFIQNPSDRSNIFYLAAMAEKLNNNREALNYYNMFSSKPDNLDKKLLDYAKKRIGELKKQINNKK